MKRHPVGMGTKLIRKSDRQPATEREPGKNDFETVKKKYLTPIPQSVIVVGMDKIYEETLLFDFYGELLTDRQKQIYGDVVMNDLSLSEAAETYGISRQGVHDMMRRCSKILKGYEDKLHLVQKFLDLKQKVQKIESLTEDERIKKLAGEILEEL